MYICSTMILGVTDSRVIMPFSWYVLSVAMIKFQTNESIIKIKNSYYRF